ncbi:TonB-dependent receptor [Kordiimonas sediminis]|nr:TonB-dependent receptor [Kordiimonas sediminis]
MSFKVALLSSAGLCALSLSSAVTAQQSDEHPEEHLEEVVVTGRLIQSREFDLLQGTNVLANESLERVMGPSLGETLDRLPGVSQTAFGPGASRPIVRGLGGDRIRILVGGIGTIDASSTSPDHDVSGALGTAKRIEVLRGPATLLYGNNAVGGVVNIIDGRIPDKLPESQLSGDLRGSFGTAADELMVSGKFDLQLNDTLVLHADGFILDADDMKIPGEAESEYLHADDDHDDHDDDHDDHDDHDDDHDDDHGGKAENTAVTKKSGTVGLSWVKDRDFFGVSVTTKASDYGVPGHSHAQEDDDHDDVDHEEDDHDEHGEEPVRIDLKQTRIDAMGGWHFDSFIEEVRLRAGYADYEHKELEGDEVGTLFLNEGYEARLHMVHAPVGGMSGAFGMQHRKRDFEAIGDEAFTPASVTKQTGLFIVEEYEMGDVLLEAGGRIERQSITSDQRNFDKNYTGISFSGGAAWKPADGWMLGVNVYRTERAPNAEELLSEGPHLATSSFELGDVGLKEEVAKGGELTIKYSREHVNLGANFYLVNYDDFIAQSFTGEEMDELPVLQYTQTDARFKGFELEANVVAYHEGQTEVLLSGSVDYVKATDTVSDMPLPRIPPLSARIGVDVKYGKFDFGAELEVADKQDRLSENELPTDGYERLDLTAAYHHMVGTTPVDFILQARNVTNEEIRHHTSQLKDLLPSAGRDIRFSVKVSF